MTEESVAENALGVRVRRIVSWTALAGAVAVVGFVLYATATLHDAEPPAKAPEPRQAAAVFDKALASRPKAAPDAPAASSLTPGLHASDEPPPLPLPAAGRASQAGVFGITARPREESAGEGMPLSAAPEPSRAEPAKPGTAAEAARPDAGTIRYGKRSRRQLMLRARGPVLN